MKHIKAGWLVTLVLLAGCQALGVPVPQTFNEKAVAAYATVESVAGSTIVLLESGKISADDAKNLHTQATTAKEGVDVAVKMHDSGDLSSADTRLQAVIVGLTAVQSYLATKEH